MYTVSHVSVIGHIWQPGVGHVAMDFRLDPHDVENMRGGDNTITRDHVEQWLSCHAGDFQSITDFSACIGEGLRTYDFPWDDEESELIYGDCMYPGEVDA